MRDQEIIGLWEAYQQVYSQPQELTEEVEIAAQYFYEMGLNEDGVDILIEDLGLEEFVEFVYDIAEEYVLTEARAGGAKIEPKLASGKEIKGKPKAATLKRLRAQKAERQSAEERASAEKPSGMKASLRRQSAVAAASKKQPKKPGLLDKVAGAVNRGIERHNAAMDAARETGKVISKAAKGAGQVAGEVVKGVYNTGRLAGHLAKKGLSEEVEEWVNALVQEGYDLSEYTWDDMIEIYLDEGRRTSLQALSRESQQRKADKERGRPETKSEIHGRLMLGKFRPGASQEERAEGGRERLRDRGKVPQKSGKDMFEHILEHLVAEGYADTNKAALAIMANMSEEWKQSIVENQLNEISQKTATRAYAASKTGEFEGADSDRDIRRTDNLEKHIKRKFGDKAVKHAERAADAQTFGRKDASGRSKQSPQPRIQKSDYRTTQDGKMHKQDQRELKTDLRIKRDRRLRAARAADTED